MMNKNGKSKYKVSSGSKSNYISLNNNRMLITGHYEFEIILKNLTKNSEKTIYRRFSDIEWLHEALLRYNPGCRIPDIPEKNMWANINVNNAELLEKRRKLIEEDLNYINNHKYLKCNPKFVIFLSNDFERNKNEGGNNSSFLDRISNFNIIPSMMRTQKTIGLSKIEDNKKLDKDRENLVRLLRATSDLYTSMKEHVKINEEKTEAIRNIIFSTKNIQNYSLNYNMSQIRSDDDDEGSQIDKTIGKNMEIITSYYEKNKIFFSLLSLNILDQLEVFNI